MSHLCVFIYADRKVGLVHLPGPPRPSWCIPRPRPTLSAFVGDEVPRPYLSANYDEYYHRGKMFNGRPVYCAQGIELAHAVARAFVSQRYQDVIDQVNRNEVRRLCRRKYGASYIELDEKFGHSWQDMISPADMKAQCLVYREAQLLIAV